MAPAANRRLTLGKKALDRMSRLAPWPEDEDPARSILITDADRSVKNYNLLQIGILSHISRDHALSGA